MNELIKHFFKGPSIHDVTADLTFSKPPRSPDHILSQYSPPPIKVTSQIPIPFTPLRFKKLRNGLIQVYIYLINTEYIQYIAYEF